MDRLWAVGLVGLFACGGAGGKPDSGPSTTEVQTDTDTDADADTDTDTDTEPEGLAQNRLLHSSAPGSPVLSRLPSG
ncbi:MAG: hypothetical protein ACI8PZ_004183 [Myxococcota bacterium]|jgi:hypothetical protein